MVFRFDLVTSSRSPVVIGTDDARRVPLGPRCAG